MSIITVHVSAGTSSIDPQIFGPTPISTSSEILIVDSGGFVLDGVIEPGGQEIVSGSDDGAEVETGGLQVVYGGVSDTHIFVGGEQDVYGSATSTTITGGQQVVETGGTATGTTVLSGGSETISAGGSDTSATVDGGEQDVYGTAIGTTVDAGGLVIVENGGSASGATVNSGGTLEVFGGGFATSITFNPGAIFETGAGGVVSNTVISSGQTVDIASGGLSTSTTIVSGGQLDVLSGGLSTSTKIGSLGKLDVSRGGSATGTTIDSGGAEIVSSGGSDLGATLSGGKLDVLSGGSATSTTVDSGGLMIVESGTAVSGTSVNSSGVETISSGGSDASATINAGGLQMDYGSASGATLSGGKLDVLSGGSATSTTVDSGGLMIVESGTAVSGTSVNSSGVETISSGGSDTLATINDGGIQQILSGGSASGTVVNDPGIQVVSLGGSATGAVLSGGEQDVYGSATSTTVDSGGGLQVVEGGGAASGATINGGVEYVVSGGSAANVAFGSGDGTLNLEAPSGLTGTISNWQIGDTIDFVDTSVTSAGISGSTLSVTADGQTYTYQLIGQQADTQTSLTSDNSGGADLALAPAVAPTISGAQADLLTISETPIDPFSTVTIGDANNGGTNVDTLTVTLFGGSGTLSGAGTGVGDVYTLMGTAAQLTSALQAVVFTPVDGVPNTSVKTSFELSLADPSLGAMTPATTLTDLLDSDPAVAPIISGTVANQTTASEATVMPFSGVTISDANNGRTNVDTLSIAFAAADGSLSGAGLMGSSGSYSLMGTASAITTALDALVFTPVGVPNTSATTGFALDLTDPVTGGAVPDNTTTVIDSDPAVAPMISGTVANQTTASEATVMPFSGVTISDANNGRTNVDTLTITLSGSGTLSGAGPVGANDVYTLMGTAAAITTALDALVFTPVGVPNTSATTGFALDLTDPVTGGAVPDNTTTVIDSDPPVTLTLTGIKSGQTTTSQMPINPFASVTIGDANNGGTNVDTLTVSLFGGSGTLSGAGTRVGDVYTLMGTAAQLTSALQAVVFTPVDDVPNTSVTTSFAVLVTDGAFAPPGNEIGSDFTQVIDTDPAVPPTSTIAETVTLAPGGSPSISVTGVATDVDAGAGLASVTMNGGSVNLLGTDGDWAYSQMALASASHSYVATITDSLSLHSSVTGSVVTVNNANNVAIAGTIGSDTVNASTGNSQIGVTDTAANGGHNSINATNGNNKIAINDGAGYDTVNASGGNNAVTINDASGGDNTLTVSGGNTKIAITDGAGYNTINASGGNNAVTINDAGGGDNTLTATGGNNSINITDTVGKDSITIAGGNNKVTIGGPAGSDTITADTNDTFTYNHLLSHYDTLNNVFSGGTSSTDVFNLSAIAGVTKYQGIITGGTLNADSVGFLYNSAQHETSVFANTTGAAESVTGASAISPMLELAGPGNLTAANFKV